MLEVSNVQVNKSTYIGLGLVTLATLMFENLLTRIFSVTMWYHFAFMAISIALFGMTVGAVIVYLLPKFFTQEHLKFHLGLNALLFAIFSVLSVIFHSKFVIPLSEPLSGLFSLFITYVVISIPFVFSGVCVSLALTKFPGQVSRLYAADLIGAALGCIAFIYVLKITDGITSVVVVAVLASLAALFFAVDGGLRRFTTVTILLTASLTLLAAGNTILGKYQRPLFRLEWAKGGYETRLLYEVWNSFSRVAVWGDMNQPVEPFGWGISSVYPPGKRVRQLYLNIDANAATVLTGFDGDLSQFDYLKYDITNIVHYIRPESTVFVIGSGGGRDILSALAFGQKSVLGVEINEEIIKILNQKYGDFTGRLDRLPNVKFVNDEARSYISRSKEDYDIIQASLIDTWAATSSGAYVLSENSVYTLEAWNIFLDHLSPRGVMTFSRWYSGDSPAEMYRLTSLAAAALEEFGIQEPRRHIMIIKNMNPSISWGEQVGIGTMLVSREPFSNQDINTIEEIARQMKFDLILTPGYSSDPTFVAIASGSAHSDFIRDFPFNIAPPTDDSPFFFLLVRLKDMFDERLRDQGPSILNIVAVYALGALLVIVVLLSILCIVIPLLLTSKKVRIKGSLPLFIYFIAIGLGFMLVEISQMQRLIIFLGHPSYGLSVVLFSLLLSSGFGSRFTQRVSNPSRMRHAVKYLLELLGALLVFGIITPYAIRSFEGSTTFVRILVAVIFLLPIGFFMGMAFPLGMKVAAAYSERITPWLWGINGAMSVCGSVIAVMIALDSGISASFWTGVVWYGVAVVVFVWAGRTRPG